MASAHWPQDAALRLAGLCGQVCVEVPGQEALLCACGCCGSAAREYTSSSAWSLPRLGIFVSLITLGYSLWHAALSGTGFICSFLVEAGPWKPV